MIYNWLAVYFLSMLGIFLFPIYGAVETVLWPVLLIAGTLICFFAGCQKTETEIFIQSRAKAWPLFLLLVVALAAFRFPYNLSFLILCAGFAVALCLPHSKNIKTIFSALVLTGLVFCLQTAFIYPYFKIAARVHEFAVLDPLIYPLLKLFGLSCSYSQDTIFVQTPRALLPLATTLEKLGLFPAAVFFIGAVIVQLIHSKKERTRAYLRGMFIIVLILSVYTLIRYVLLCIIYIDFGSEKIFWQPTVVALSFLPLPFITAWLTSTKPVYSTRIQIPAFTRSGYKLVCAAAIGCCALAALLWFHDPGKLKGGRVLIDEYYSNWEWTERALDTDWYGIQSVYNYYCFGDFLRHYYAVTTLKKELTVDRLESVDVFIVKTPTRSFTEQEIDMLVDFVARGGGLFLIGDHTNVFGTTININPLAKRFGISFNYDSTYNLVNNDLHPHTHNTLLKHPVLQDMPYFLFATSCSMDAPLLADDILTASNLKAIGLDYSRGGYFPDKKIEQNYTFGLFLQTVGIKHGRGRVLAFPDSTCFSNFYMYIPGKPEYALGAINWLNRQNSWETTVLAVSLVALVLCALYLLVSARNFSLANFVCYTFCGAVTGLAIGALISSAANRQFYLPPQEHTSFKTVAFETAYCEFKIPDRKLLHNPQIDYHTFYVWNQRLGYRPDLFALSDNAGLPYDVLVFVNSVKQFSEKDLDRLEQFVAQGGRVLVLDKPYTNQSTAHQILERFDLAIKYKERIKNAEVHSGDNAVGTLEMYAPVKGGTPVLFAQNETPIIAYAEKEEGLIAVACFSPSFTNKHMGETETVPDEQQQFLYKLEFWLMTCLMDKKFIPFEP